MDPQKSTIGASANQLVLGRRSCPATAVQKRRDEYLRKLSSGSPQALLLPLNFSKSAQSCHVVGDSRLHGRNRVELCKWNGWGYKDTYISLASSTTMRIFGSRYSLCGKDIDHWHDFVHSTPGIAFTYTSPAQKTMVVAPQRCINTNFIDELQQLAPRVEVVSCPKERLFHGHGHTCQEIFALRYGTLPRLPDVVLYPKSRNDVEAIVSLAVKHVVCLIPFGGGTSVTLGLTVPETEERMVATVSLGYMQTILALDRDALLVSVEAGAVGAVLEEQLRHLGVTLGHEPDSLEFSTVGGWVATRASGMKKNAYGNIEDMVVDVVAVTAKGTLNQHKTAPRVSSGPSIQEILLGSEGTLGIITEVVLRVKLLPERKAYGCLAFPSFKAGVEFLRHVTLRKQQPASIRLMDRKQTQCGSMFKASSPGGPPLKEILSEKVKKFYLNNVRGWKEEDLCACTLLFEGTAEEVSNQQHRIYQTAKTFGALPVGQKHGERGYQMTFMIAYLRDFIMEHHWVFESFEASMPWPVVLVCYEGVKRSIEDDCTNLGIKYSPLVMARVSQVYDGGVVLYFYFGFNWAGLANPMEAYSNVEINARQVILDCGGCISHHHGVGKLRKEFMPQVVGETGMKMLQAMKAALDPHNIFGNANVI